MVLVTACPQVFSAALVATAWLTCMSAACIYYVKKQCKLSLFPTESRWHEHPLQRAPGVSAVMDLLSPHSLGSKDCDGEKVWVVRYWCVGIGWYTIMGALTSSWQYLVGNEWLCDVQQCICHLMERSELSCVGDRETGGEHPNCNLWRQMLGGNIDVERAQPGHCQS